MPTKCQEIPGFRRIAWLGVIAVIWAVTDRGLEHSPIWSTVRSAATRPAEEPLRIEAELTAPAASDGPPSRVIFLGSSLVRSDIDERDMSQLLEIAPEQIGKISLSAASPIELAMLTPRIVQAAPQLVALLTSFWSLEGPVDVARLRVYDSSFAIRLYGLREWLSESTAHLGQMVSAQHLLLRNRGPLRSIAARALLGEAVSPEPVAPEPAADARTVPFACDGIQMRALARMGSDLERSGIRLVVVATPVAASWSSGPERLAEIDRCLARTAAREGFAYVAKRELPVFEPAYFLDGIHMGPLARRTFTRAVAERIRALL